MDFSGTLISSNGSLPPERDLQLGTKVFGSIPIDQHIKTASGALAEFVVIPYSSVMKAPEKAGLEECAGLPIAGTTALALVDCARLKRGDKVLVVGASGGIGHLVVQMVKSIVGDSGRVVGVCRTGNVEFVRGLGCDEVSLRAWKGI